MPDKPNVILDIIAVTYKQDHPLKCFVESILSQTNPSWRLLIVHDGPDMPEFLKKKPKDKRITVIHTPHRYGDYGHSLRDIGLKTIKDDSYYTLLANSDDYYAPVFIEEMCMKGNEDFVYCNMSHHHWSYQVRESEILRRAIDVGSFVVRTKIAKEVGFKHREYHADWLYIQDIMNRNPLPSKRKVNKVLFIKN